MSLPYFHAANPVDRPALLGKYNSEIQVQRGSPCLACRYDRASDHLDDLDDRKATHNKGLARLSALAQPLTTSAAELKSINVHDARETGVSGIPYYGG